MKELKDNFVFLCTSAAKRRSPRQKGRFLNYLTTEFTKALLPCRIEQKTEQSGGLAGKVMGGITTSNLIVGDIKKAKKILVAGYDTPERAIFNLKYYPFSVDKNRGQEKKNLILKNVISFVVMGLSAAAIVLTWGRSWPVRIAVMVLAALANYLAFERLMRWANWYNFNKNSGAVAVLWQMLDTVGILDGKVAYVFCDEAANSYLGYRHLQAYLEEKNRNAEVILLDCVAWGEGMYVGAGPKAREHQQALAQQQAGELKLEPVALEGDALEQSPLSLFPKAMMITCGSRVGDDVVVYGTRTGKDSNCDLQQLEDLTETLVRYCQA